MAAPKEYTPPTDSQTSYLKSNHNKMSVSEMAKNMKVDFYRVKGWLNELELEPRKAKGPTKKPVEVAKEGFFVWDKNCATI